MGFLAPRRLCKGELISLVAPSSPFLKRNFKNSIQYLKGMDFKVCFQKSIFAESAYVAGSDQRRLKELQKELFSKKSGAIFFARGGYGCTRILPAILKNKPKKMSKLVMGLSDLTPLLNWLSVEYDTSCVHGPVLAGEQFSALNTKNKKELFSYLVQPKERVLQKRKDFQAIQVGERRSRPLRAKLLGGNLAMLEASIDTPYEVCYDKSFLFLEEVCEPEYRVDRMLTHLVQSKRLDKVKAILLGDFTNQKNKFHSKGWLKDLFRFYFKKQNIPIVSGIKAGHVHASVLLPIGGTLRIDSNVKNIVIPPLVS